MVVVETRKNLHRYLQKLLKEAERWGVEVKLAPPPTLRNKGRSYSPTGTGYILWPERMLCWGVRRYPGWEFLSHDDALEFLHEIAHCILGTPPNKISEPNSPMLYYEWQAIRRLKLPGWSNWMRPFGVTLSGEFDPWDWSELTPKKKHQMLQRSLAFGIKAGLFTRTEHQPSAKSP